MRMSDSPRGTFSPLKYDGLARGEKDGLAPAFGHAWSNAGPAMEGADPTEAVRSTAHECAGRSGGGWC